MEGSIWIDLLIIVKTLPVVLHGMEAYLRVVRICSYDIMLGLSGNGYGSFFLE